MRSLYSWIAFFFSCWIYWVKIILFFVVVELFVCHLWAVLYVIQLASLSYKWDKVDTTASIFVSTCKLQDNFRCSIYSRFRLFHYYLQITFSFLRIICSFSFLCTSLYTVGIVCVCQYFIYSNLNVALFMSLSWSLKELERDAKRFLFVHSSEHVVSWDFKLVFVPTELSNISQMSFENIIFSLYDFWQPQLFLTVCKRRDMLLTIEVCRAEWKYPIP